MVFSALSKGKMNEITIGKKKEERKGGSEEERAGGERERESKYGSTIRRRRRGERESERKGRRKERGRKEERRRRKEERLGTAIKKKKERQSGSNQQGHVKPWAPRLALGARHPLAAHPAPSSFCNIEDLSFPMKLDAILPYMTWLLANECTTTRYG